MNEAMAYYNNENPSSPTVPFYNTAPSHNEQYCAEQTSNSPENNASSALIATGGASRKVNSSTKVSSSSTMSRQSSSPAQKNYIIKNSKIEIHSLPSKSASVVGSLTKGQKVEVKNIVIGWASIFYNNKISYIEESALSFE